MVRKKKVLQSESMPEFQESIDRMPEESRIYVDRSLAIADKVRRLMEKRGMTQKDLAVKMFKTEPEISKWMAGEQNFSLRTIAKMEVALNSKIIKVL